MQKIKPISIVSLLIKKKREVGNMAQVVEHLSSNLSTTLKTKKGPKHI
jgi:hypothetical protein